VVDALLVSDLTVEYAAGAKPALCGVSLCVRHGQALGLLGENGSGKSTLVKALQGGARAYQLPRPYAGRIAVNGFDVQTQHKEALGSLGVCSQQDRLWGELTVFEHVQLCALLRCRGVDHAAASHAAERALRCVSLLSRRGQQARTLSGGMKRRLSLAMAMAGVHRVRSHCRFRIAAPIPLANLV
jgi:ABC-type multidrug transport system ATPase subunit